MSPVASLGWGIAGALALLVLALLADARVRRGQLARGVHELRGPLTAARLGLGLESEPLPPRVARRLGAVDAELRRAALLVDDLSAPVAPLAVIGRRRDGLPAGPPEAELHRVVAEVVEARAGRAAAAGRELEVRPMAATVAVAPLRLAQALGNLIDNALVHGQGTVVVEVAAGPSTVRVEVCDDGPGLGAPLHRIIGGRGRPRSRGRHGHGLSVAAEVARAHGGRLATAPSVRGARLVLELPRSAEETKQAPPGV